MGKQQFKNNKDKKTINLQLQNTYTPRSTFMLPKFSTEQDFDEFINNGYVTVKIMSNDESLSDNLKQMDSETFCDTFIQNASISSQTEN